MNELEKIEKYLDNLKFKKQTIGGISESDVLAKIQKLSDLYAEAFRNQEIQNFLAIVRIISKNLLRKI